MQIPGLSQEKKKKNASALWNLLPKPLCQALGQGRAKDEFLRDGKATEKGSPAPVPFPRYGHKKAQSFTSLDCPLEQRAQSSVQEDPHPCRVSPCWSVGMGHLEGGRDMHARVCRSMGEGMLGWASPHLCRGLRRGECWGQQWG